MGRGLVLGVSLAPTPRGRGPSAPQFLECLAIYAHTLYRKTNKFDVVTHMGRGLALGGQPRPHSNFPKGT